MKAKSRKRLLISSVAMLLVAMLALGTATFAWFSQNTKATASGITAKTSQASKIVLSENGTNGWTNKLTFNTSATGTYTPVTPGADITSPTWVTTLADFENAGVKGAQQTYKPATENTDYTSTNLYVKFDTTDTSAKQKVKVDLNVTGNNNNAMDKYLRVALVPADATTIALVADPIVWGVNADDFAKDRDNMSLTTPATSTQSITTTTNKALISSMELTGGTPYHFSVYVWYEGTDPQCIDSNANTDFSVGFDVTNVD